MSLQDRVRAKEAELRQIRDYEVAVVYDASGAVIVEESGLASSVNLGPYVELIRSIGRATLVHNHPLGWQYPTNDPRHAGSSFSPEDIGTACYAELAEVRAVTPLTRYVMRPSAGLVWNGEYWEQQVRPVMERHKLAVIRATLPAVTAGRLDKATAEARFWHEVWLRVAQDLPLDYQRFDDE